MMKSVLDALSWLSETWKISITAEIETEKGRLNEDYDETSNADTFVSHLEACIHIPREASALSVQQ